MEYGAVGMSYSSINQCSKDVSFDGVDSACSGIIGANQSTWLQTTVTGPGTLSFRWKVSSEERYDWLTFYIDGTNQTRISGTTMTSFEQKSYTLLAGKHTLKWDYTKDGSADAGSDCGWVDTVSYTRIYAPNPPTGMSATDGTYTDKIAISWDSVAGADKYYIYRYTSNSSGSAMSLGSTTSTSYNDTSATPGVTYYYWVKAYQNSGSIYSGYSSCDTGYRKLSVPTGFSSSATTSGATISWSAVSGATGYVIYRSTSSSGSSLTQVGTSTKTTYTDSTGSAGRDYYYWVAAKCSICQTSASGAIVCYKKLPAPSGFQGARGPDGGSIALWWNAVSGATGYKAYRGDGNNKSVSGCSTADWWTGAWVYYAVCAIGENGKEGERAGINVP